VDKVWNGLTPEETKGLAVELLNGKEQLERKRKGADQIVEKQSA
jgi:hypothetical protein